MNDLLIITPSRGRPQNVARLLNKVHELAELDTGVYIGVDEDDPALPEYQRVWDGLHGPADKFCVSARKTLTEWTNFAAQQYAVQYSFLGSFGDDHVPRTKGFDRKLVRSIQDMGGTGFAYPYDGNREDVPEAVVLSSDVVDALGWMCEPSLRHYYVDDVWGQLGRSAGCIRYLRAVAVDHLNAGSGRVPSDKTYDDSVNKFTDDREAYGTWLAERMNGDVEKIRALF